MQDNLNENNLNERDLNELVYSMRLIIDKLKSLDKHVRDMHTLVNGDNLNDKTGLYSKVQNIEKDTRDLKSLFTELDKLLKEEKQKNLKNSNDIESIITQLNKINQNFETPVNIIQRIDSLESFDSKIKKIPVILSWTVGITAGISAMFYSTLNSVIIPIIKFIYASMSGK